MQAIMLAAGVGARLGRADAPPKVLLEFGGRTLLARHIEILRGAGLATLVLGVGYEAERIAAEVERLQAGDFVRLVRNPDYRKGSITTLWALRDALRTGDSVLLMDADVLYDRRLIERLLATCHPNCFLLDRDIEPGEEPVKLGIRGGVPVDFHRRLEVPCDFYGESVGFFRFSPETVRKILGHAERRLKAGEENLWYEEAIRDAVRNEPAGAFGFEDVTGLPWVEIDFPEDVRKAEALLPELLG